MNNKNPNMFNRLYRSLVCGSTRSLNKEIKWRNQASQKDKSRVVPLFEKSGVVVRSQINVTVVNSETLGKR